MKTAIALLTAIAWALWLGGMIALFVFVQSLFKHNGTIARSAAPILFTTFDLYQLILCVVAMLGALLLGPLTRSPLPYVMAFLFCLCAVAAMVLHMHYIPTMESIRVQALAARQPLSAYPQYGHLHGQSMIFFSAEALLLLLAGLAWPVIFSRTRKAQ